MVLKPEVDKVYLLKVQDKNNSGNDDRHEYEIKIYFPQCHGL